MKYFSLMIISSVDIQSNKVSKILCGGYYSLDVLITRNLLIQFVDGETGYFFCLIINVFFQRQAQLQKPNISKIASKMKHPKIGFQRWKRQNQVSNKHTTCFQLEKNICPLKAFEYKNTKNNAAVFSYEVATSFFRASFSHMQFSQF